MTRKNCFKVASSPMNATPCVAARIVTHPQSTIANAGEFVRLSVVAGGSPPFTYQWQKDGLNISGATSQYLDLYYLSSDDVGKYQVRVSNACNPNGVLSVGAVLVINVGGITPAYILVHPAPRAVAPGTDVSFSVGVGGTGPFTFQWYKDDAAIVGATNSSLDVIYAQEANQGHYHVVVTNAGGSVQSVPALLVVEGPVITPSPGDGGGGAGDGTIDF